MARASVALENGSVLTYSVPDHAVPGDYVYCQYGNYPYAKRLLGEIVSLGGDASYTGPVKSAEMAYNQDVETSPSRAPHINSLDEDTRRLYLALLEMGKR